MRLYIVRHGLSEGNVENIHQLAETPLSPLGRRQAEILAARLKKIDIDHIVSSDFTRAKETAEIINASLKRPIRFDPRLQEYRRPSSLWGKKHDDEEAIAVRQAIEDRWHENWRHSDEETFDEFKNRAQSILQDLIEEKTEKTLIVSHGNVIRMLLATMLFGDNLNAFEFKKFFRFLTLENTGVTICERRKYPGGEEQWKLITANDHSHLT